MKKPPSIFFPTAEGVCILLGAKPVKKAGVEVSL